MKGSIKFCYQQLSQCFLDFEDPDKLVVTYDISGSLTTHMMVVRFDIRHDKLHCLQMALVLTFGSAMPVIKVGRMAGQFAKPRSEPDEVRGDVSLPSYRGDIINREEFTPEARRNNPHNMVEAYHQSAQTLNILRAFSTGGYADISRLHAWNLDFVEQTEEGSRYDCVHCDAFCSTIFDE